MSVYIKGMEMPSGCDDCYFCGEMGMCSVLVATHINSGIVGEYRYNEFERPPFCPLVPVPEHGRLIDTSAKVQTQLYDDQIEDWIDADMTVEEYLGYCFNEVPTIIPADHIGDANEMVADKEGEG